MANCSRLYTIGYVFLISLGLLVCLLKKALIYFTALKQKYSIFLLCFVIDTDTRYLKMEQYWQIFKTVKMHNDKKKILKIKSGIFHELKQFANVICSLASVS